MKMKKQHWPISATKFLCGVMLVAEQGDISDGVKRSVVKQNQQAGTGRIRFAAVGDILLPVDPRGKEAPRDVWCIFTDIKPIFEQCEVVFGNLECSLDGDGGTIATEPRVISEPELIRGIKTAGFDIVTLANNHAFDCLREGFCRTKGQLEEMGIGYFGAGDNLDEAVEPVIMDVKGIRLGFIGAVDRDTGPNRFAESNQCGVAELVLDRMVKKLRQLKSQVDHAIVSVHWGKERFLIPSPGQVEQAHALVEAGASMVLGHHPHVLQGLEMYRGVPIIYSLGNFVASEVYFSDGDRVTWNRRERTGCILVVELDSKTVQSVKQIPTYDSGRRIEIDQGVFGQKCIAGVNRMIKGGVTLRRYRREHLRVNTVRPILNYLRWSRLKTLRLGQIRNALAGIFRAGKIK